MNSSGTNEYRAIVITGSLGAGKSAATDALVDVLAHHNIAIAGIDMDYLRRYSPIPSDDPFGVKLGLVNVASIANNYRAHGINNLVLADVITSNSDLAALQHALGEYTVYMVRLSVSLKKLEQRLRQREPDEKIAWYLQRAPELEEIMTRNMVGDIVIDINNESPKRVATMIAEKLELI